MNLTPQDISLTLELIKLAPINGGAAVQVALLQQKYQAMLQPEQKDEKPSKPKKDEEAG